MSIDLDGYVSASRSLIVAKNFANMAESDDDNKVLLKFTIINETGKHYISLDREDYTSYIDEEEVLIQAGIVAKVNSVEYEEETYDQEWTIFNIEISEAKVRAHRIKQNSKIIIPIVIWLGYNFVENQIKNMTG